MTPASRVTGSDGAPPFKAPPWPHAVAFLLYPAPDPVMAWKWSPQRGCLTVGKPLCRHSKPAMDLVKALADWSLRRETGWIQRAGGGDCQ